MTEFLASISNSVTSLFNNWQQFHFLRPEWFFLLVVLVLLLWLKSKVTDKTQWHQVLPPHLSKVLLDQQQQKVKQNRWLTPFVWLIAITALAGPTWQKIEKPVFQVKRASVIVMDMSMSMRATDVKPNRLAKARFKAIDLAKAITDGEIALVAYAGDAFTISPLTPDNRNIVSLIPSLSPEIMPTQGSSPVMGLNNAADLLRQAGYMSGDIYWLTDGVDQQDVDEVNDFIAKHNYKVNIMSFGTAEGAPIKMIDNSLLKDSSGSIVIPKLNARQLAQFSNISSGVFVQSTPSDIDIRTLTSAQSKPEDQSRPEQQTNEAGSQESKDNSLTGDDWQEFGPTLVLLILPLVLFAFRKGAVLSLVLVAPLMFNSKPSYAQALPTSAQSQQQAASLNQQEIELPESSWTDFVFDTKDQVAKQAFEQGDFNKAQHTFDNEQWKGSAAYKAGDYETAFQHFQSDESSQGLYNQGNALANLGKLDEAIEAYEQAIKQQPDFEQAKENKALLEQMKQQQENQEQQGDQQQDQQGDQSQDNQEGGQQQDSEQDGEQNSENQNQQDSSESSQENGENGQQQEASEPTGDPNQQDSGQEDSQQQESQQQAGEESDQEQQSAEQNSAEESDQSPEQQQGQQAQGAQLTPEELAEQENQQKLQQLLRKVSDDPSVLLRNKMILESRKRQQQRTAPKGATKSW